MLLGAFKCFPFDSIATKSDELTFKKRYMDRKVKPPKNAVKNACWALRVKKSWKSFSFSFCVAHSIAIQKMKDVHKNKRKVVFHIVSQRMEKRVRKIYAKLLKFALGLRNLFRTLCGYVCECVNVYLVLCYMFHMVSTMSSDL